MLTLLDHPIVLLLFTFAVLWGATHLGARLQSRRGALDEAGRADFDIVLGAGLTLLGLLVGFSFSMASSRYDERKGYEESEANAIGTAYTRAELFPTADALKLKQQLRQYNGLRIRFYTTSDHLKVKELSGATEQAQSQLWNTVASAARADPTPLSALAVASINDVLNAQGYAQAAAWNRLPEGAWILLYVLGIITTGMIGYRFQKGTRDRGHMLILPAIVSIAFFLIADIDCPQWGVIRVLPDNLQALAATLS